MVKIKPFRGILYSKGQDFSRVITPPNDVISEEEKLEFEKNEHSFVKLIKPESYEKSAQLFNEWLDKGILEQDSEKHIYVYQQCYKANGQDYCRLSFISLLKLEPLGKGVLPHEKILEKDLKDRIELIKTTKANFGIPFVLYDDKHGLTDIILTKAIENKEPYIDFINGDQVQHKLWKVNDPGLINQLTDEMEDHQCIIADGHHRYTSELKVKELFKGNEAAEYGLICFVNSFNEGLVILPTNRIIFGLDDLNTNQILKQINEHFEVEEVNTLEELPEKVNEVDILINKEENLKNIVFGFYDNLNKRSYLLRLKHTDFLEKLLPGMTDISRKLDVNILHKVIIENILNISEEKQKLRQNIDFVKGNEETIQKAKENNVQFALFVNPPLMREVFLTARAGEVMPQKSTYFFPKIYSGLVSYKF